MTLTLVTAPPVEPVSLAEAGDHLRLTPEGSPASYEDIDEADLVSALITAARQHIDGKDGWLGRALVPQTWDLTLDRFPCATRFNPFAAIRVPLPPLISVGSVKYTDPAGDEQTLATSAYLVDSATEPARIMPVYGTVWPSIRYEANAVTVRFTAGYDSGSPVDASAVPETIKRAMLLLIGHLFENRETTIIGATVASMPFAVDALLAPYRVWDFA
jgi:uncharacterized phiE125 gp8 family phage protein